MLGDYMRGFPECPLPFPAVRLRLTGTYVRVGLGAVSVFLQRALGRSGAVLGWGSRSRLSLRHHRGLGRAAWGPRPRPVLRRTLPSLQLSPLASGQRRPKGWGWGRLSHPKPGQLWEFLPPARPRIRARVPAFPSLWPGASPHHHLGGKPARLAWQPALAAHRDPIVSTLQTHWEVERKCLSPMGP